MLGGTMESFEREIKEYLKKKTISFEDNTGSHDTLDFTLSVYDVHFDAKEKKQHFNVSNWQGASIPEEYFFILDDLAARKILLKSPRSFLVIRDNMTGPAYYVFSIIDLLCLPKHRVKRRLEKSVVAFKGKWYIDLRHAASFATLESVIEYMIEYPTHFKQIFNEHIDCWGEYAGEDIQIAGTVRRSHHWKKDLSEK